MIGRRRLSQTRDLPIPPIAMRELVGPSEVEAFTQPRGERVYPTMKRDQQYDMVLDFGCGCGRVARKLALASRPMPKRYVGVDLHAGMIEWCAAHLTPVLPRFTFVHHNVYNPGFNPDPDLPRTAPLPAEDESVSLLIAHSVFTHLLQDDAVKYLDEVRRVLRSDGVMVATFFLFERKYFPMMQDFQNALYINANDPTNAVIFDRGWLLGELAARGLAIRRAQAPAVRGFQWMFEIVLGGSSIALESDHAPFGHRPPPVASVPPHTIS